MCSMPAAIFLANLASEPSLVQVSIHMVCLPQSCAHLHPFEQHVLQYGNNGHTGRQCTVFVLF